MNTIIITIFETEWKFIQKIYNRYNIAICAYLTEKMNCFIQNQVYSMLHQSKALFL